MTNTRDLAQSILNDNHLVPGEPIDVMRILVIDTIHSHAVRRVMELRDDRQSNLLLPGMRAQNDTQRILLGAAMVTAEALDILGITVDIDERPTAPGTQPVPETTTRIDGVEL